MYVCFAGRKGALNQLFSVSQTFLISFCLLRTLNDFFPSIANDLTSQIYGFFFLIKQPSQPPVIYTKLIILFLGKLIVVIIKMIIKFQLLSSYWRSGVKPLACDKKGNSEASDHVVIWFQKCKLRTLFGSILQSWRNRRLLLKWLLATPWSIWPWDSLFEQ